LTGVGGGRSITERCIDGGDPWTRRLFSMIVDERGDDNIDEGETDLITTVVLLSCEQRF